MSNEAFYRAIEAEHAPFLARGELEPDPHLIGAARDTRRCVSVIVPLLRIAERYERYAAERCGSLGAQYLYPAEDLHVTVFDFTDARLGYARDEEREGVFAAVLEDAAARFGPFELELRGAAFTRNAGIIKVMDSQRRILALRECLRSLAAERGLPNQERFKSESAHATFLRFRAPPPELPGFLAALAGARDFDFGVERVRAVQLVEHDWYNRAGTRRVLLSRQLEA